MLSRQGTVRGVSENVVAQAQMVAATKTEDRDKKIGKNRDKNANMYYQIFYWFWIKPRISRMENSISS